MTLTEHPETRFNPQVCYLFWFGLDKRWVPIKAAPSLPPSSAGQGRGNMMKILRVETRTGRDHSPTTVMDKPD